MRSRLDLFSNFTYFLDDPVNGDQFEQVDRRTVAGGAASHSWTSQTLGRPVQQTVGVQLRSDDIPEVALYHTVARQRLTPVRNDAIVETSGSVYYSNETAWTRWLRTNLGLRGDRYRFHVANSGTTNAGLVSPKASVVFGPWSRTEYFINYGQGFHSNDARAPDTPLVRARGAEVGVRTAPSAGWQSSFALWRLDLDSELVFAGDAGTTEASHPSRREGVEWTASGRLSSAISSDMALTLARARFTNGDYIPGAMNRTFSTGATYGAGRLSGSMRLRYFGPRALTEDNSQRSGSSTLVNAMLTYALVDRIRLRVEALNLFDTAVDDITYFYASRLPGEPVGGVEDKHFHPAEPRTLRFSLLVHL